MRLSTGHWHRAVLILSISSAACGGTNFDRLTDERWTQQFGSGGTRPADVPWLLPVLAH